MTGWFSAAVIGATNQSQRNPKHVLSLLKNELQKHRVVH